MRKKKNLFLKILILYDLINKNLLKLKILNKIKIKNFFTLINNF